MKTNVTYIDGSKFEAIVAASGLPSEAQKGFLKVKGASGRNVYVALTKRVGRVDLSGFTFSGDGIVDLGEGTKIGNVRQQLDFDRPEAEILETFAAVLAHLGTLGPAEKAKRSMAPKAAPLPKGWSPKVSDRLELIKRVAAEKGLAVSPRTLGLARQEELAGALAADDGPDHTPGMTDEEYDPAQEAVTTNETPATESELQSI